MKIALYISPAHTVPPQTKDILAPWWLVRDIADGLVRRGHTVTLFGAKGSKTLAKLVDLGIDAFGCKEKEMTQKDFTRYATFYEQRLASAMFKMSQEGAFDIIGGHWVYKLVHFVPLIPIPVVFTLHDPLSPLFIDFYKSYLNIKNLSYISISKAQQGKARLPFAGTVYNGLHLGNFPLNLKGGDHLLTVGRIRKEKGITEAISVARKTNTKLTICGEYFPQYPDIFAYWENEIKPEIDNNLIFYKGLLTQSQMSEMYRNAKALMFPICWEEPFGLVMIEAMACGTPVIAYNRGSVLEVVKDGVTGFIVDPDEGDRPGKGSWIIKKKGIEGLVEAVKRIEEIDRSACRKHVENNFTTEKMVEGYEKVYEKIINGC